ncbi:phage portal protein [bacterium 210820-DFI.6.37]|nr:phage portal protein [bacterium 210820-DFI.6.37]
MKIGRRYIGDVSEIRQHRSQRYYHISRPTNRGYSEGGASYTSRILRDMIPNSGDPREDIDYNLRTLRERCRMLYMDAPVCTSAINTNRTNVVGVGLRLKSAIDRETLKMTPEEAEAWQKKTEAEFKLWANQKQACDATGMNDFFGMQQLCLMSWLMSGDVFAVIKRKPAETWRPYSLRLHIIEADRVRTPTDKTGISIPNYTTGKADNGNLIYDGVEIDKTGMVVAYHVANTYPDQIVDVSKTTEFARVEAYGKATGLPNILHIMASERPDQYRGVPYLAQVIKPMLQMRRYTDAELMSAVVQSFFTAWVTTEDAGDNPFNETIDQDEEISKDPNEYEVGPGTINFMEPGEDIKFGAPTHPNNGFDAFMRSMCEQTGAALEVPADLLLKSFNSSYSASRGALLEAWKAFKMRREWLTNDLCRPAYEIWMTEAVARGRIAAPGFLTDPIIRQAYLQSEWIGPSQGQLDPTKEVAAAVTAINEGLSTREAETIRLNGSEYSSNVDKLAIENEKLRVAQTGKEPDLGKQITNFIEKTAENAAQKEVETQYESIKTDKK